MNTSSFFNYHKSEMKIDYLRAVCDEPWQNPLDFGCIDAPKHICAGSTYSSEYMPGKFIDLCRLTRRGA